MENSSAYYASLLKPAWAPPAEVFGPVWTILYIVIILSFGYVAYLFFNRRIPFSVILPFAVNLVFNVLFTPLAFGIQNLWLASVDVLLVGVTLLWAMVKISPYAKWVAFVNTPYLAWVAFASFLQLSITLLNI